DRGSDPHAIVEVDDILVGHPETTRRNRLADGLRLVGAVDAVHAGAEIDRAGPERIVDAAAHVARQIGTAAQHLAGWRPVRPFLFRAHPLDAAPGKARAPHPDPVADRL